MTEPGTQSFWYEWDNSRSPGYAVHRGRFGVIACFVVAEEAAEYCRHRNIMLERNGTDEVETPA